VQEKLASVQEHTGKKDKQRKESKRKKKASKQHVDTSAAKPIAVVSVL